MSSAWIPTSSFQWGTYQVFYASPWCYSRVIRTDRVHLMPYWSIFPSFSHGGGRSLTCPSQFPSLGRDTLYSPRRPLFLSSSSIWALSGASFETRRVPFSHFPMDWDLQRHVTLGHTPPSLSLLGFLCTSSLLDLFLDLYESSYRGIPPSSLFLLGHTLLSSGLPCLVLISWSSDPFAYLCELSPRASPYHHLV